MGSSYVLKGKGVDLSQGPPERKRDVVHFPAVIETPLVSAENAPSSSGRHSNVMLLLNLMMNFLCTVFSWSFPSYMLKFDFSLLLKILFGCVLKFFLDPSNQLSSPKHQDKEVQFRFELPTSSFTTIPFSH
jgi:hypothetical protein